VRVFHRRRVADHSAPAGRSADVRESGAVAPVGAVNGYTVLETVAALPVSTWRYLWEPEDVRHLGPMAQDWHAAFGFNRDDTTIPVVDGLGVCLVSIQALNRRIDQLTAEVDRLRESAEGPPQDSAPADTGTARPSPTRPRSVIPLETP
jgi:hypothetical protein